MRPPASTPPSSSDVNPRDQQIVKAHAPLILAVVQACHNADLRPAMDPVLKTSADNGWTELVAAIRAILAGNRDPGLLRGLDEEDSAIVEAILSGLLDPATLPDPDQQPDPAAAGPGIASIIHAASRGDHGALSWLGNMAEQMQQAGGDMAKVGGNLRRMMDGERNTDLLCQGMGAAGEKLTVDILSELARLQTH